MISMELYEVRSADGQLLLITSDKSEALRIMEAGDYMESRGWRPVRG